MGSFGEFITTVCAVRDTHITVLSLTVLFHVFHELSLCNLIRPNLRTYVICPRTKVNCSPDHRTPSCDYVQGSPSSTVHVQVSCFEVHQQIRKATFPAVVPATLVVQRHSVALHHFTFLSPPLPSPPSLVSSLTYGRDDPAMKTIHKDMKTFLQDEQDAMEARVKAYEEEQRRRFSELQSRAHRDRTTIFRWVQSRC